MEVLIARLSSPGLQRELNEDNYLIMEQQNFAALFDGMGGHESGEVASNMAKETIENLLNNSQIVNLRGFIEDSKSSLPPYAMDMVQTIRLANRRIFNFMVENAKKRGMGTTVVAIRLVDNLCSIAHVGDSRAYRIRNGSMEQLTNDHSLISELIEDGDISPDEAEYFEDRNVITRALGIYQTIKIDLRMDGVQGQDYFLLCSDGLTRTVPDQAILEIVLKHQDDLESAVGSLIQAANDAGGPDNITVILMKVIKLDPPYKYNFDSFSRKTIPEEDADVSVLEDKFIKSLFDSDRTTVVSTKPWFLRYFSKNHEL